MSRFVCWYVRPNPYYNGEPCQQGGAMEPEIDLVADLNAEDDDGLGWASLSDARDAARVRPRVMLIAGNRFGKAVGRAIAAAADGQGAPTGRGAPSSRTPRLACRYAPAALSTWLLVRPRLCTADPD